MTTTSPPKSKRAVPECPPFRTSLSDADITESGRALFSLGEKCCVEGGKIRPANPWYRAETQRNGRFKVASRAAPLEWCGSPAEIPPRAVGVQLVAPNGRANHRFIPVRKANSNSRRCKSGSYTLRIPTPRPHSSPNRRDSVSINGATKLDRPIALERVRRLRDNLPASPALEISAQQRGRSCGNLPGTAEEKAMLQEEIAPDAISWQQDFSGIVYDEHSWSLIVDRMIAFQRYSDDCSSQQANVLRRTPEYNILVKFPFASPRSGWK